MQGTIASIDWETMDPATFPFKIFKLVINNYYLNCQDSGRTIFNASRLGEIDARGKIYT